MAKQSEEEKRDGLFDMSLGDGLIEVDGGKSGDEGGQEEGKTKKKPDEKSTEDVVYDDGTFEINTAAPSVKTEKPLDDEGGEGQQEHDKFFEKTEDPKEKEKKAPSKAKPSDSSSSSPYLAFARDRANEGVFLDFNDDEWKELVERNDGDEAVALRELSTISMQEQIRIGVEDYKESLTDEDRALYEAKEKGVPLDEYSIAKRNFEKYSKVKKDDLADNEKLQTEVVGKVLEMRGFTKEEISEEIEGYKALENLQSKAEKALDVLPKTYKGKIDQMETNAKAAEKTRQDNIRQRVARMKRNIENTPEIIPGIKLTKPAKEKILSSMVKPVATDENGNPLNPVMHTRTKNPEAFEMMIHYYHALGLFNIDDDGQMKPDFSKIAKVQKTKATDEIRSVFETTEKQISGTPKKVKQLSDDELDEFDEAFARIGR